MDGDSRVQEYITAHKVDALFEYLLSALALQRPENPTGFVVDELKRIQREGSAKSLFTHDDVAAMFSLIDINNEGTISQDQLLKCLINLGVPEKDAKQEVSGLGGSVTPKTFTTVVYVMGTKEGSADGKQVKVHVS